VCRKTKSPTFEKLRSHPFLKGVNWEEVGAAEGRKTPLLREAGEKFQKLLATRPEGISLHLGHFNDGTRDDSWSHTF
jgi:hypothetical protein